MRVALDGRPAGGWQHQDGDSPLGVILLVAEILVRGYQRVEVFALCCCKQVSVGKGRPAEFVSRLDGVRRQGSSQGSRCALIEEDSLGWEVSKRLLPGSRHGEALGRMLEDGMDLLEGHSREPLDELGDARSTIEVLEEGLHGDARAAEHPGSADAVRDPLDGRALRPVQHEGRG